ncbi:MAG TPA: MFS transporter [Actinomycetota bacterium]|nr:MFS transporter [Actinomycetota bacterium]
MSPAPGAEPTPSKVGVRVILSDPAVRIVILIIFVVMLGYGIVAPILPLYARSFGVGYSAAGLLISAFAFARLVTDPFSGPVVDRFGERRCAAAGVAIVGISSILTGLAPTFVLAVVARGAGGGGSALLFTALTSYLLKIVPKDRMARTLSLFYGAFNVGVIAGSPVGGLIANRLGLAAPLFVYAGLLFASGLLYMRLVRDPVSEGSNDDETADEPEQHRFGALFRRPGFVTTLFLNFAYLWMIAAVYDTLVPLFGHDHLGMSTLGIGAVFAVALATELLVLYPAGAAADRRGRRFVMIPSMAGLALIVAALGFSPNALSFGVLMAVLGIGSGYAGVPPGAMLSDVVPTGRSGTAVGVFRFAGDLGLVLGPLVAGGAVTAFGFVPAFWVVAIPIAIGLVLAIRTPETLQRHAAPGVPTTQHRVGTE